VNAQLAFVGNGYIINKTNANPYQDLDVRGKVMIVAGQPAEVVKAAQAQQAAMAAARAGGAGAPAAARGGRGGAPANPLGVEGTDFTSPQTYAAKNGALGIIMVPTFQQLSSMAAPAPAGRGAGLNGPAFQVVKFQAAQPPAVPIITAGLELINALFQSEKLTAAQVFEGATANAALESFALNGDKKVSLRVAVNTLKGHTENVVGIIEGSDPVLKNEYVIFSAHLDHIGFSVAGRLGDPINNGADDDGSGCAALMAMARTFMEGAAKGMKPKRSLLFLWVTGEERGLWGSRYFCQFPPIDIAKVIADLNMDMISRAKGPEYRDPPNYLLAETGEVFIVGPHISSSDLNAMLETVNAGYLKMKLNDFYDVTAPDATHDNLGNGQRIFTRSDHYNFARMGIPVAFFTTGLHIDYHQVSDSADRIDFKQFEAVARTVAALGWNLSNTATPPKLNEKLPDTLIDAMKQSKEGGWGKLTPVIPPPMGGRF
jgi:Zn-dependent M28 family amino/carboxypeptidase